MAATNLVTERGILNGVTDVNGNVVFNIASFTDQVHRIRAEVLGGEASASHLLDGLALTCEGIFQNKNGTLTGLGAQSGSVNPLNSNSTGEETAWPQGAGTTYGTNTAIWTISSTNIVLTVHVTSSVGGNLQGVTVYVKYEMSHWGIT